MELKEVLRKEREEQQKRERVIEKEKGDQQMGSGKGKQIEIHCKKRLATFLSINPGQGEFCW